MKWQISKSDSFPVVEVELDKGEGIKCESGAMVAMSEALTLTGTMDGGFMKAMARKFSGESFFMQSIEAERGSGWALLAPPTPGAILQLDVKEGQEFSVQKSGFLASSLGVDVSTKVQNLVRGIFSGEGLFVVKLSGKGTAFLSTYGSVRTLDVKAGETVLVDNGHLVAWDSSMRYDIVKAASSWVSAVTAGSGLGCRFHGPGQVIIQTRNPYALGAWLFPYIPLPPPPPRQV